MNKDFYKNFEDKHRGSRAFIKERLLVYLPFILPLKKIYSNIEALDIGCGRGEWLELLSEYGITAKGIDVNENMLKVCLKLGLSTIQGDGINYIREQSNESIAIVSAFHVIEHISFNDLQVFIQEALRVLKPGGILIIETPNPENIKVATENFYLDPTHMKPIPSEQLMFLTNLTGFKRNKILRLNEPKAIINKKNINLMDIFGGVSPDYAVIAQKNGDDNILSIFDNAFNKNLGLTLNELTIRFERRFENIERRVLEAEKKAINAKERAMQAEKEAINSKERAIQAEANYHAILNSKSWKITKPLRLTKLIIKNILKYIDIGISKIIQYAIIIKMHKSINRPKNQQRKLLIDCSYIYTSGLNTGIQRVVRNIINNIGKYTKENNLELVTVLLANGSIIKVDINQKDNIPKNKSKLLNIVKQKLENYITSYQEVEKIYKDDILLMLDSTWHLDIWSSIKYAKRREVKIIGITYDLIPISHPQFCDEHLVKLFSQWYDKSLLYFDGYISISKTVMLDVQKFLKGRNIDISRYSFDYFHLGTDFKEIEEDVSKVRKTLQNLFKSNKSIYLIVSTIEPRKNHKYLFETFKKLWKVNIDVTLVIVGRVGWKTENLIAEIKKHEEYQKRLWIFNDLDDNELIYCYNNAKALLFPSFIEGYGLPIIESLQKGLPVLASDTPIHREVGKDMIDYFDIFKENSLFNKIRDIEQNKIKMKIPNREKIKIYSWSQSSEELLMKVLKQ